jgi:hypothetical protein
VKSSHRPAKSHVRQPLIEPVKKVGSARAEWLQNQAAAYIRRKRALRVPVSVWAIAIMKAGFGVGKGKTRHELA